MPSYSQKSLDELGTANMLLQNLFNVVIQYVDCTILFGNRPKDLQFEFFKKGRTLSGSGEWFISNKAEVVTYKDGYNNPSMHNYTPSKAVDAVSYPIDWEDVSQAYYFAGIVKGIAIMMGIKIRWGGDFNSNNQVADENFKDLYHFELVED